MEAFPPLTMFFSALYYISQIVQEGLDNLERIPALYPPVAYTESGLVLGSVHYARGRGADGYAFFRGIPYAEPPVGNLRFEPPKQHPGWSPGILRADYWGKPCWQINMVNPNNDPIGNEDCLTLNIATRNWYRRKNRLPADGYRQVIVFIYGGHFMVGDTTLYPPTYFMEDDIVFVSMNYRVASFGFLNTGDGVVAGNMGLKDQAFALRWIKENIRYFNGDPDRVILLGQSAGAVSAHLHTLSPYSNGLFAGAISMSGNALSPWAFNNEPEIQAKEFGAEAGCPTENSQEMVDCLKTKSAYDLSKYHIKYMQKALAGQRSLFGPSVDSGGEPDLMFIPEHPLKILESGKFSNKPWVNGVNSGDGLVFLLAMMRNKTILQIFNEQWDVFAPKIMFYDNHPMKQEISNYLRSTYLKDFYIDKHNLAEAGLMFSDRGFFYDTHRAALLQSKNAEVYLYFYNYAGLFAFAALAFEDATTALINWAVANEFDKPAVNQYGICHGDEVSMLFNVPFVRKYLTTYDPDYDRSRRLVRLWTSFGDWGRPYTPSAGIQVDWPSIRESNPSLEDKPFKTLLIQNDRFDLIDEPYYRRTQYWKKMGI